MSMAAADGRYPIIHTVAPRRKNRVNHFDLRNHELGSIEPVGSEGFEPPAFHM